MIFARSLLAAVLASGLLLGCGRDDGERPKSMKRDTLTVHRHRGYMYPVLPEFAEYPVPEQEIFRETPATVDMATASWARRFRSVLDEGARKGANFAGHYALVSWRCGVFCRQSAIVDVITGRIYPGPQASRGYAFRIDSRLLIVDPLDSTGAPPGDEQDIPEAWLWRTGGIVPVN